MALSPEGADRATLVNQLSRWSDDTDGLIDGRYTIEEFCEWADRAIELIDDPAFLGVLHANAVRYSLAIWAERDLDLATNPWAQVKDHLDAVREARGWELVYPD